MQAAGQPFPKSCPVIGKLEKGLSNGKTKGKREARLLRPHFPFAVRINNWRKKMIVF